MWDGITYPFPNFNGDTVEVWGWISNVIQHFKWTRITYPGYRLSQTMLVKEGHWQTDLDVRGRAGRHMSHQSYMAQVSPEYYLLLLHPRAS